MKVWKVYVELVLSFASFSHHKIAAVEICSAETGGGICPDGNTCCLMADRSSGCIGSDMGKNAATCCDDELTGCAVGYSCRQKGDCIVSHETNLTDPLVWTLPRYRLCKAKGIEEVLGLPIVPGAKLAYYSSHGPIEQITETIDMALVMIHGSGRNADDYFCSLSAAVELQTSYSNVLLVTPRFYSDTDKRDSPSFLFWKDEGAGPWRYGANSVAPATVSSYTALDTLVQSILKHIPNAKKLVIAGHSSGGQMTQRWTLLTSTWVPDRMHAVVANPSSYAYLTPLRFIRGDWSIPNKDENCSEYNKWEWGLEKGGDIKVEYKDQALANASHVTERFRDRHVVYLSGDRDRCNVSVPGWCHSHGLETSCSDELQGSNRFERSARYVSSLQRLGVWTKHVRHVVLDAGHDHALIYQSSVGLKALFDKKRGVDVEAG